MYLLDGGPGDRWLVDSGHWSERWQLLRELRASGLRPADLTGVLLTHYHSDHAGNAGFLQREHGVRVLAHRADAAVLDGAAPRPVMGDRGNLIERALCAIENRFPSALCVDRALDGGDAVASMEVHAVPGHTDGSVLFRHAATGCLLTGDTLLTARPPLTLLRAVVRAHDAFSRDVRRAHASLDAFHAAGWHYDHVLAGHGRPLVADAERADGEGPRTSSRASSLRSASSWGRPAKVRGVGPHDPARRRRRVAVRPSSAGLDAGGVTGYLSGRRFARLSLAP